MKNKGAAEDENPENQPEMVYTREETRELVHSLMDSLSEEQQKKGYKLYSVAPVVLLVYLLRSDRDVMAAENIGKTSGSSNGGTEKSVGNAAKSYI